MPSSVKFSRIITVLLFVVSAWALTFAVSGCATDEPARQSAPPDDMDTESRRSPASYFMDRFQVQKDLPAHSRKNENLPFFFKKCNIAGQDRYSRQYYQCDVGF